MGKKNNHANNQRKIQKLTDLLNNAITATSEKNVIKTLSNNGYGREFNSISSITNVIKTLGANLEHGHIGKIENQLKSLAPKEPKANKYPQETVIAAGSLIEENLTKIEEWEQENSDNGDPEFNVSAHQPQ